MALSMRWRTYEEVAAAILGRLREELGLSTVEGKQSVPGQSGTEWELDAKGIRQGSDTFVIVECRRHTTSRIKQGAVAALAFQIQDTGAAGGFIVSPLGLQDGAQKVAGVANIHSIRLNADATPQEFALSFIDTLFVGLTGVEARAEAGKVAPSVMLAIIGVEAQGQVGTLTAVVENNVGDKTDGVG